MPLEEGLEETTLQKDIEKIPEEGTEDVVPIKAIDAEPPALEEKDKTIEPKADDAQGNGEGEASTEEVVEQQQEQQENVYHPTACLCLSMNNVLRAGAIKIYENPYFDRTTMTIIGFNCITLALFDPTDPDCNGRCKYTSVCDQIFAIYFTFEMTVKMLALGVFSLGTGIPAYFSSNWNRFDFIIVVTGLIDFVPGIEGGSLSSLRTFRVLRPLRAINKFPKLRVLVKLLMDTVPMLSAVGMLCFFIFFVFGIVAVQFWKGLMHQRCFVADRNTTNYFESYQGFGDDGEEPFICAMGSGGDSTGLAACISSQGVDAEFTSCRKDGPIPFWGAIHYDNILAAWVALFQIITLEGWVDQMYIIQGAYSFHTGWIYFCTLVVIGAFFAVNLALVVISSQFGNSKGSEMAAIEAAEAKAKQERKRRYEEAKARGEKLSMWEQFRSGDLFRKSDDRIAQECDLRIQKLTAIAEKMEDGDAKAAVQNDIARLQNRETFPITEVEAQAQGGCQPARYAVRKLTCIDERFGNCIMAAIALNVLLMATEHHNQPQGLTDFLEVSNYVFCGIFALEMVLKQFALGLEYFNDNFNCFDCLIVFISFLEIALGGGGLSVLRMLRLVRVFKLVKFLPELQRQIAIMGETLGSVLSFLVLLSLFIFIFAILGMFIFGNKMTFTMNDEDTPWSNSTTTYKVTARKNFDTLLWALVTIFQTLTLEDWNAGMYDGVRAVGTQWGSLYYILLIMTGNYIMFNLFVAILIDGFGAEEDPEEDSKEGEEVDTLLGNPLEGAVKGRRVSKVEGKEMLAAVANLHANPSKTSEGSGVGSSESTNTGSASGAALRHRAETSSAAHVGSGSGVGDANAAAAGVADLEAGATDALNGASSVEPTKADSAVATKYIPEEVSKGEEIPKDEETSKDDEKSTDDTQLVETNPEVKDNALFLFSQTNCLRKFCNALKSHPRFDQFIMSCIILNSIFMAVERPSIEDGSGERTFLDVFGHIFTFIFSVEMIIKLIAQGVFWGIDPYWSSPWNRLDGTIVVISWLDLLLTVIGVTGGMLSILKICRMLRALRPLRAISRLPGLKRIVNVLILSLAPIGTTLIIVGVFFFLFGILGGQIFSGQFYYCDADGRELELRNVLTKADCLQIIGPDAWKNQPYNFDHLGNSLMTLFVLSSIDGWVELMYHGVDIAGVDMQPQENNNEFLVLFFILFLLIGGFFIINMFVGVIVENFQKNGAPVPSADNDKPAEPEPEFDDFEDRENYPEWRRKVLEHAISTPFESFIAAIIILNVVVMGSEHYDPEIADYANDYQGMSDGFLLFLRVANYIFTVIFIYELVVKYIAFGCQRFHMGSYPRSLAAWNNFDCFIVFISVLGILFDDVIGADNMPVNPAILRILRILRVARILKLLKSAKDLVILLTTVSRSLAQVGNLGLLLFLLFFIYSALGIELFGRLACTDGNPCDGLSEYANFENFGMAMLVLFRLSTGDNWNGMMKDGLRGEPPISNATALIAQYGNKYGCDFSPDCQGDDCCAGCDPDEKCKANCCANAAMTPLFYISFCVMSTFVMLNLVVATLMGELERAGVESAEEEAEANQNTDDTKITVNGADSGMTLDTGAKDGSSLPKPFPSPEPSPGSLTGEDVPSGGKVKLDPLPNRPVSPGVFVPFAPDTVDNETDETAPIDTETAVHTEAGNN